MRKPPLPSGAGLGLRRPLMEQLEASGCAGIDFLELAPENWIGVGGRDGRRLRALTERHPFVAHGLSASLGGPGPLDHGLLLEIRDFLDQHGVLAYTEHLSFCSDDGQLYDLMPIPFTEQAIRRVANRIREAQDVLERPIAVENVSYYAAPGAEMSELDFLRGVLQEADCGLLLDVNNVFVNATNHGYDPAAFLAGLPRDRVWYLHTAGHYVEAEDLLVDTHGADVREEVWSLLAGAYRLFGERPTLLERDFNFPPLASLQSDLGRIRGLQARPGA